MTKNLAGKLRSSIFYMLFFAGVGPLFSFMVLYFTDEGLSGSEIGVLMGIGPLIGLVAGPLWGGIADAIRRHRLVLSIAIIGNALGVVCFLFVHGFWAFFALMVVQAFFGGPIISLVDHATMSMLEDQKEQYGPVRMGGTLGFLAAALSMGAVVARFGMQWIFWFYSLMLVVALLPVQQMRFKQGSSEKSMAGGMLELLANRKWQLFLVIIFVAGCGNSAITSYLFLYLEKIGTSDSWKGIALAVATVVELPALFFANYLLKRLKPGGLLTLGLVGTAIRCILYGVTGVWQFALAIQLLQAIGFPLLLVAGVSYADENAPAGMGATAQGIFNSAFMGFGFAAGGFLGGVLIDYIGVQAMFFVFGTLTLLATLGFALLQRGQPVPQPA